jgi:lipoate---protein ligase
VSAPTGDDSPFELFVTDGTDPRANLALERELLREVDVGLRPQTVRLWIDDECLVRGPHRSRCSGWYHEQRARELGIPVYTRSTGGGCVYHDVGNVNWSFYLRRAEGYVGYPRLYRWCAAFIIEALEALGLGASFAVPNRIDISGRKVSGLAARALQHATLVHGTLLVSTNLERLEELCIPPPGCPPVVRLCDFDSRLTVARVIESLLAALDAKVPPSPNPIGPSGWNVQ